MHKIFIAQKSYCACCVLSLVTIRSKYYFNVNLNRTRSGREPPLVHRQIPCTVYAGSNKTVKMYTYSISKEVIFEGPSRLKPHSFLWVVIGQKETEFLSCKCQQKTHKIQCTAFLSLNKIQNTQSLP